MHFSFQAVFEEGHIEVDEEAKRAAGQTKIGKELGVVDWLEAIDGFELDDDLSFDEKIESVSCVDQDAIVADRLCFLTFDNEPALG